MSFLVYEFFVLLTLPLFIEGVRRSREGVTSGARRTTLWDGKYSALRLERPRPSGTPSINRGGVCYSLYNASTGFSFAARHERASTMALVTASTMRRARANTHQ